MRFFTFLIGVCFLSSAQAGEEWLYSEYAETDALASVYEGVGSPEQPMPSDSAALIVYFPVTTGCIPYFQVLAGEKANAFQLRIDGREIRPFQWFNASEDGIVAMTIAPGDENNQNLLERRAEDAYWIARELMVGSSVEAVLQPSGNILRWSLNKSRETISMAYEHCATSIENEFPTRQRL